MTDDARRADDKGATQGRREGPRVASVWRQREPAPIRFTQNFARRPTETSRPNVEPFA